ncbi:MAG TPA: DoxX family protein [Pyrinomonadaceae bacterium]|nr:DoxX family protein [Pyrinomonadaceae bacterium]
MQATFESVQFPVTETEHSSNKALWAGRVIGGFPALFLLLDGVMKLFKPDFVVKATVELGYPESTIVPLGLVLTAATILYIIPRTAVFGAILLTGYLGGAVATHVRVGGDAFSTLFPVFFGGLLWFSLYLRNSRLRELVSGQN